MARTARRIADRPPGGRRSEVSWSRAAVTMTDLGGDVIPATRRWNTARAAPHVRRITSPAGRTRAKRRVAPGGPRRTRRSADEEMLGPRSGGGGGQALRRDRRGLRHGEVRADRVRGADVGDRRSEHGVILRPR